MAICSIGPEAAAAKPSKLAVIFFCIHYARWAGRGYRLGRTAFVDPFPHAGTVPDSGGTLNRPAQQPASAIEVHRPQCGMESTTALLRSIYAAPRHVGPASAVPPQLGKSDRADGCLRPGNSVIMAAGGGHQS
jgi:hypothetical protein